MRDEKRKIRVRRKWRSEEKKMKKTERKRNVQQRKSSIREKRSDNGSFSKECVSAMNCDYPLIEWSLEESQFWSKQ